MSVTTSGTVVEQELAHDIQSPPPDAGDVALAAASSGQASPVTGVTESESPESPAPAKRGRPRKQQAVEQPEQPVQLQPEIKDERGVFSEMRVVEIWEAVTEATVYIHVRDTLNGGWKAKRVGGKGAGRRLQISVEERRYNQDLIPDEGIKFDPFVNGMLICVQGDEVQGSMTNDDLLSVLKLDDDDTFVEFINDIESEIVVRRLLAMSEKHASKSRYDSLLDLVDRRYRVGGTQRVVQEMIDAGERLQGFML